MFVLSKLIEDRIRLGVCPTYIQCTLVKFVDLLHRNQPVYKVLTNVQELFLSYLKMHHLK